MGRYFEYAEKEKRYHTYDYYLKKAFGSLQFLQRQNYQTGFVF